MAEEKKKILEITKEQQATIIELSSHFACIAHACTWKQRKEEDAPPLSKMT
jgi:hypothetical protein